MANRTIVRRTLIGLGAGAFALAAAPSTARAQPPPIDVDSLAPPAGTEPDDAQIDELLGQLDAVGAVGGGSSSLTGPCGGIAFSYDSDGALLDAAWDAGDDSPPIDLIEGGQAFTDGNPFQVDTNGSVTYFGFAPRSGDGPMDYEWSLQVAGFTVASGSEENSNGNNRNAGTIDISQELPIAFDAKVDAGGDLTIGGSTYCDGNGTVEFIGNGLLSVPGLVGIGLLGLGGLGIIVNARPARTWRA